MHILVVIVGKIMCKWLWDKDNVMWLKDKWGKSQWGKVWHYSDTVTSVPRILSKSQQTSDIIQGSRIPYVDGVLYRWDALKPTEQLVL